LFNKQTLKKTQTIIPLNRNTFTGSLASVLQNAWYVRHVTDR